MRSRTPEGAARPLRAADDRLAGRRRAARPAPGKVVVVDGPERRARRAAARGRRARGAARAQRDRRRRAAAAPRTSATATVLVLNGDVPLVTADGARRARRRARAPPAPRRRWPRWTLDDPAGYGRVVRDADGRVERVVETKAAGDATRRGARDPRGQRRRLRLRRRRAARRARAPDAPTTPRASSTCPTSLELLDATARRRGARRRRPDAAARRQRPRRPRPRARARPARASIEAHMRAGVTIVDPAIDAHRRRRRDRRRHRRSSRRRSCAARRRVGERCTDRAR